MTEVSQEKTLMLPITKMAHIYRMAHPSVNEDKPNDKWQQKYLTGGPAQLARNMPQAHILSEKGGFKSTGHASVSPTSTSRIKKQVYTSQLLCLS